MHKSFMLKGASEVIYCKIIAIILVIIISCFVSSNTFLKDINLESINARINEEVCYDTIESLKDVNLMAQYKECKSVIKAISGLKEILDKHKIDNKKQNLILNDYLLQFLYL